MANRERGELSLVAGGRTFTLRLTTNSCCELESFAGRTSDEVTAGVNTGSFRDVRLMLWMALRDHHPDVATLHQDCLDSVGHLIDVAGGRDVVVGLMRTLVLLNAQPEGDRDSSHPREAQLAKPIGAAATSRR